MIIIMFSSLRLVFLIFLSRPLHLPPNIIITLIVGCVKYFFFPFSLLGSLHLEVTVSYAISCYCCGGLDVCYC